jgi:cytochrome c553
MKRFLAVACLAALAGGAASAQAQQPAPAAPPPPAFAAANLSESGVRSMASACAMCHGPAGKPVPGSTVASLAGRPAAELVGLMNDFKAGKRPATIMHQVAKGYADAEIAALAEYFSKQR